MTFQVLTKQWYINVLARIRINAFRIELAGGLYEDLLASAVASVEAEAAVGNAVYLLPSFYNHDCGQYNYLFSQFLSSKWPRFLFLFFHSFVCLTKLSNLSRSFKLFINHRLLKTIKVNFNKHFGFMFKRFCN